MFQLFVIVVTASIQLLTSATHFAKRSSDPMLEMCFPLCENETIMEMECAHKYECFQVSEAQSDEFTNCLKPCWGIASSCFTLCSESLNAFITTCADNCSNSDNETCVSDCFNSEFLRLKNEVLYHTQTYTLDFRTNPEPTSTGIAADLLNEDQAPTPSLDAELRAASSPFLRLAQNKTLRSDKSNSFKVLYEEAYAGYHTAPTPGNLETQYDELEDNSTDFLQAENNNLKASPLSRYNPSKEALQSFLANYGELLEQYLKISFLLNRHASDRIVNRRIGGFEIPEDRRNPERNVKHVNESSVESTVPLNKEPHYESESKIDRLLQANREFLQRDGVDMDNVDKALNKLLELLYGSQETGSELIG